MRRVIFVDDAPEILQHLRRHWPHAIRVGHAVLFPSAASALTVIRETPQTSWCPT